MANTTAFDVGSFFINQYYLILKEKPEALHQFYNDSSTVTWVDGDEIQTASNVMDIHSLITSLNVTGIEVTNLIPQYSLNGGILLSVSGVVRSDNFSGKRTFIQTFFLAPQESGFFVLNDILHFNDEIVVNQHPVPEMPDIRVDSEVHASSPHQEQSVSNNEFEEETREYVNSLHIEEDSPIDKYSLPDEQHEEYQTETVVKEYPATDISQDESAVNHVNQVEDPSLVPVAGDEPASEPVGEPAKVSYASILRAAKGLSTAPVAPRPTARQSMPAPPPVQRVQASAPQLNPSASSFVPVSAGAEEFQEDVLTPSVYVRSLPSNVTNADLEKEFKKFGKIKNNGVFIKNKKDIGVCFAFVDFEDMSGVHNALKASPIELLGRQVYIEERRAGSNGSSRGRAVPRGRGRGRGSYQSEPSRGRGGNTYNSARGNGFQQRSYQ